MSARTSSLAIPDSLLAKETTDILRLNSNELLFNHSIRVFLSRLSRVVRKSSASTLNYFMSPPHFTIWICERLIPGYKTQTPST